ncbi:MAG TPA: phosphate ABC transporter permease subunit PstC [Streptosporangiaceae bacterium]|nr:phosphate ABC transporter permease subunit PstC [Streptosporangiaceae bacterium]
MAVAQAPASVDGDRPRHIVVPVSVGDRVYHGVLRGAGVAVLVITASILFFLVLQSIPAFKAMGFGFFTTSTWFISTNQFGIAAILPLSIEIALTALIIGAPVGVATALFISEYAPFSLRKPLIAMIDLMAAIPSIIVALFARFYLMPRMLGFDAWLSHHLGWIPVFSFRLLNSAANYATSTFIAGVAVSILVIPIITSLSRQVFSQAPQGEREAAYALGATKWAMIRTVVLPFGRGGLTGASMLGLGRAMGETIAVSFILVPVYQFSYRILETGGNSVTNMIAIRILDAGPKEISALMAAGMCLFVLTMGINTVAAIIISRSRSGASVAD